MKITRTIELSDEDRLAIQRFLKLADEISEVAICSMEDVYLYFAYKAEITDDGYSIGALHQIGDIK